MKNFMKGAVSLADGAQLAIVFVVFVLINSIGGQILSGVQTGQTANSAAYNITGTGLTGLINLGGQNGTIGIQ